ncbi:MAG: mechanosensitive ion channel family protein [Acidobacteriota bacterium]
MKPHRLPLSILLLTSLLTWPLAAQETAEPAVETDAEETYQVPPEHASAQATMRTFFDSFDSTQQVAGINPLDIAGACLDLSQIREGLRSHAGRELSLQLKEILDKTEFIVVEDLSDDPQAEPYRLAVYDLGQITLAPDDNGEWLFDAATVDAIPSLLRGVRELDVEVIEGVTAVETLTPAMWLRSQMPKPLLGAGFLLEHWQWLALLGLLVLGLVLDRLTWALCRFIVGHSFAQSVAGIEPERLKRALRPVGLLAAALFWWAGIYWLGLPPGFLDVMLIAVHFVVAVSFVWTAYRLVDIATAVLERRAAASGNKFDDLLVPLVRKSLKILTIAFGLVFIADTLDLPIRSILAGLGIGGLAIALAAQDLVKNLFGSILVIMDQPFSVGDYVSVGSVSGTVEELGFRSTRIRTPDNSVVTLPNSNLITTSVDNLGMRRYRRWKTMLGLTYDTPPEKIEAFCEGVRELIRQNPHTRKEGFYVYFREFSPSSLDVLLQLFFDVPDWETELQARQQLGLDILRLAAEQGVEMAFPTQTVHVQGVGSAES